MRKTILIEKAKNHKHFLVLKKLFLLFHLGAKNKKKGVDFFAKENNDPFFHLATSYFYYFY